MTDHILTALNDKKQRARERAKERARLVEKYADEHRNNQQLLAYYSKNILAPNFFKLDDYTDYDKIRHSIPCCANMNDPDFDPAQLVNARFFIIRCANEDNVHKAVKYGIWTSTNVINRNLNAAYKQCKAKGDPVFLLFT